MRKNRAVGIAVFGLSLLLIVSHAMASTFTVLKTYAVVTRQAGTFTFPDTYTAQANDVAIEFACAMNTTDITTPGTTITFVVTDTTAGGSVSFPWNSGPDAVDKQGNPQAPFISFGLIGQAGHVFSAKVTISSPVALGGTITRVSN